MKTYEQLVAEMDDLFSRINSIQLCHELMSYGMKFDNPPPSTMEYLFSNLDGSIAGVKTCLDGAEALRHAQDWANSSGMIVKVMPVKAAVGSPELIKDIVSVVNPVKKFAERIHFYEKDGLTYLRHENITHPCGYYQLSEDNGRYEALSYIFPKGCGSSTNMITASYSSADEAKKWLIERLKRNIKQYYPLLDV